VSALVALATTPLLHALGFAPDRVHLLAWVAFVPWFVALRRAGPGSALVVSALVTLAGSWLVVTWLPRGVAVYYGQPLVLGIALMVGVWALTVAPWVLLFTACYRALARRTVRALPLLVGAAWAANELARGRLLIGDPFGLLGYSQADVLPLVQIADVTGVYGVGAVIAAVNAGLAELWLARHDRQARRERLIGLGLAVVALAVMAGYGELRLRAAAGATEEAVAAVPVAAVQANLDLGTQWREEFYGRNLDAYLRLTLGALATKQVALVVWPESALTFFLDGDRAYRAAIVRVLGASGVQLLTGGPHAEDLLHPRYFNSAFLLAADGTLIARYDKQRLLPFAEYFPFASNGLLRRRFGRVREFTAGGDAHLLPTVAGTAGVVICNEVMYPEVVGARVRAGATYLVNLTNDSWLGDPKYAAQAYDISRLRAVEQRRYLVRASTSGPSAVVDPSGRVVAEAPIGERAAITGAIRPRTEVTPYGRWGDAFGIGCVLLVLGVVLSPVPARALRRGAAEAPRQGGEVEAEARTS
jgi:apolipoprotein N-acyltransferase